MRKIKEVLRLHFDNGLGRRAISRCMGTSRTTIGGYLDRAEEAGLGWPLPESLTDHELEQKLFPSVLSGSSVDRQLPDWSKIQEELQRKGVTLMLLWEEYRDIDPQAYSYSRFCQLYRRWVGQRKLSMRQTHKAGEKLFVDYAGHTLPIVNPRTGEIRESQIFLATLGASSYTFAEATWNQDLSDWLGSHRRAFEFIGGVPEIIVPDNLKSAVTKPCRYDPDLNPSYQDLAEHYGTAVIPARVRKPKDKAKVEVAVQIVERWILARLRNHTFFSLAEANAAISELLIDLNNRLFKKLPGSRREAFESLDQPVLKPLPATAYEFAGWKKVRVSIDYHVEVEGHYYSVPYQLQGKQLDARISAGCIEICHKNKRVASHVRSHQKGRHTTISEHMPKAHKSYVDWTPQRLIGWAAQTGPQTAAMVEAILASRCHPQQGFRSAMGLIRLGKVYGAKRLEAACALALTGEAMRYKSVKSILETGLDKQQQQAELVQTEPIKHNNIRGGNYYH